MKPLLNLLLLSLICFSAAAQQNAYADSIRAYQASYIKSHGAVKGKDKELLHFFDIDEKYKVAARVERIYDAPWFRMETSGKEKKVHRTYAVLHFTFDGADHKLHVYQSQQLMGMKEYADHLFIPFTDFTSGEETYENGRYIDILVPELENSIYMIDFNKAYNPYCAYISDFYNCPVPPKENNLSVAIKAGEKKFGKLH
jgi:uncharacterized protein (DUF1684 family)